MWRIVFCLLNLRLSCPHCTETYMGLWNPVELNIFEVEIYNSERSILSISQLELPLNSSAVAELDVGILYNQSEVTTVYLNEWSDLNQVLTCRVSSCRCHGIQRCIRVELETSRRDVYISCGEVNKHDLTEAEWSSTVGCQELPSLSVMRDGIHGSILYQRSIQQRVEVCEY
jgi:hypothetical protein